MAAGRVHVQNLADYLLPFPYVVPDVLDPACFYFGDMDKTFPSSEFLKLDIGSEIRYILYSTYNKFSDFGPVIVSHSYHFSNFVFY